MAFDQIQVFTTHHWMVRIYKLKPQKNRIRGKIKKSKSVCVAACSSPILYTFNGWVLIHCWCNCCYSVFNRNQAQQLLKEAEQERRILGTETSTSPHEWAGISGSSLSLIHTYQTWPLESVICVGMVDQFLYRVANDRQWFCRLITETLYTF